LVLLNGERVFNAATVLIERGLKKAGGGEEFEDEEGRDRKHSLDGNKREGEGAGGCCLREEKVLIPARSQKKEKRGRSDQGGGLDFKKRNRMKETAASPCRGIGGAVLSIWRRLQ